MPDDPDDALTPTQSATTKPRLTLLEYLTTAKPLPPEDWFEIPDDPPPEPIGCFDDWPEEEVNRLDTLNPDSSTR